MRRILVCKGIVVDDNIIIEEKEGKKIDLSSVLVSTDDGQEMTIYTSKDIAKRIQGYRLTVTAVEVK